MNDQRTDVKEKKRSQLGEVWRRLRRNKAAVLGMSVIVMLFVVAIQRIPKEYYEAALVDGVGPIRTFFSVTVPLVREMTTLLMIVTISGAFLVFNEIMATTQGGPNNSSRFSIAFGFRRVGLCQACKRWLKARWILWLSWA